MAPVVRQIKHDCKCSTFYFDVRTVEQPMRCCFVVCCFKGSEGKIAGLPRLLCETPDGEKENHTAVC